MECNNFPGSFECSCKTGFKMESKKCNKNDNGENACTGKYMNTNVVVDVIFIVVWGR